MKKKILLAEDSQTMRKVFELAFAQSDIALTVVDNGDDAVRLARETAPDLVVADVTLPGRDGFQVAEDLRTSGKGRSCPVLILSGTIIPFDEERFRKSGASGVLFKPFESQELAEKVRDLLTDVESPTGTDRKETAPPREEPWDFSDILEEAEKEGGKQAAVSAHGEEPVFGISPPSQTTGEGLSLGEFDVSLADIEKANNAATLSSHIEGDPFTDAPAAVTDLSTSLEAMEEFEEIDNIEEVDLLQKEAGKTAHADAPAGGEDEMRERFSARAQEIFEKVAAEAVEKVLWEHMERFSAEFSARIRESVEAVAWEVIPATAEALIREEIARIRQQAEKKSP